MYNLVCSAANISNALGLDAYRSRWAAGCAGTCISFVSLSMSEVVFLLMHGVLTIPFTCTGVITGPLTWGFRACTQRMLLIPACNTYEVYTSVTAAQPVV